MAGWALMLVAVAAAVYFLGLAGLVLIGGFAWGVGAGVLTEHGRARGWPFASTGLARWLALLAVLAGGIAGLGLLAGIGLAVAFAWVFSFGARTGEIWYTASRESQRGDR